MTNDVISITLEYKKSLDQLQKDFNSTFSEIANNSDISNGVRNQFNTIAKELNDLKQDLNKGLSDIGSDKVTKSSFSRFKKTINDKFNKIRKEVDSLNKDIVGIKDQLNVLSQGIDLSKFTNQFKDLQLFVESTNQALERLIELTGSQGIELFAFDTKSLMQTKGLLTDIRKEIRQFEKEEGKNTFDKLDILDEDQLEKELNNAANMFYSTSERIKSLRKQMSGDSLTGVNFKKADAELSMLQLKLRGIFDYMKMIQENADTRALYPVINEDLYEAMGDSYDKYQKQVEKKAIDSAEVIKNKLENQYEELSKIMKNALKTNEKIVSSELTISINFDEEAKAELWENLQQELLDIQHRLSATPLIIPVKLTVISSKANDVDGSKTVADSVIKTAEKELNKKKDKDLSVDVAKTIDKTLKNAVSEAKFIVEDAIRDLKKVADTNPVEIKFKPNQADVTNLRKFILNTGKGKDKFNIGDQVSETAANVEQLKTSLVTVKELFEEINKTGSLADFTKMLGELKNISTNFKDFSAIADNIKNVEKLLSGILEQAPAQELLTQWDAVIKKAESITKVNGDLKKNQTLTELAKELKTYQDMGGQKTLVDIKRIKFNKQVVLDLQKELDNLNKIQVNPLNKTQIELGQFRDSINKISDQFKDLIDIVQKLSNTLFASFSQSKAVDKIESQWSKVSDIFSKISNATGDINLKKSSNEIRLFLGEYQKYVEMGGTNTFSDLTSNSSTISKLNDKFKKLTENSQKFAKSVEPDVDSLKTININFNELIDKIDEVANKIIVAFHNLSEILSKGFPTGVPLNTTTPKKDSKPNTKPSTTEEIKKETKAIKDNTKAKEENVQAEKKRTMSIDEAVKVVDKEIKAEKEEKLESSVTAQPKQTQQQEFELLKEKKILLKQILDLYIELNKTNLSGRKKNKYADYLKNIFKSNLSGGKNNIDEDSLNTLSDYLKGKTIKSQGTKLRLTNAIKQINIADLNNILGIKPTEQKVAPKESQESKKKENSQTKLSQSEKKVADNADNASKSLDNTSEKLNQVNKSASNVIDFKKKSDSTKKDKSQNNDTKDDSSSKSNKTKESKSKETKSNTQAEQSNDFIQRAAQDLQETIVGLPQGVQKAYKKILSLESEFEKTNYKEYGDINRFHRYNNNYGFVGNDKFNNPKNSEEQKIIDSILNQLSDINKVWKSVNEAGYVNYNGKFYQTVNPKSASYQDFAKRNYYKTNKNLEPLYTASNKSKRRDRWSINRTKEAIEMYNATGDISFLSELQKSFKGTGKNKNLSKNIKPFIEAYINEEIAYRAKHPTENLYGKEPLSVPKTDTKTSNNNVENIQKQKQAIAETKEETKKLKEETAILNKEQQKDTSKNATKNTKEIKEQTQEVKKQTKEIKKKNQETKKSNESTNNAKSKPNTKPSKSSSEAANSTISNDTLIRNQNQFVLKALDKIVKKENNKYTLKKNRGGVENFFNQLSRLQDLMKKDTVDFSIYKLNKTDTKYLEENYKKYRTQQQRNKAMLNSNVDDDSIASATTRINPKVANANKNISDSAKEAKKSQDNLSNSIDETIKKVYVLRRLHPKSLLKEPESENKLKAMEIQILQSGNEKLSQDKEGEYFKEYSRLWEKYRKDTPIKLPEIQNNNATKSVDKQNQALSEEKKNINQVADSEKEVTEELSEEEKLIKRIKNLWSEISANRTKTGLISTSQKSGNQERLVEIGQLLRQLDANGQQIDLGLNQQDIKTLTPYFGNIASNKSKSKSNKSSKKSESTNTSKIDESISPIREYDEALKILEQRYDEINKPNKFSNITEETEYLEQRTKSVNSELQKYLDAISGKKPLLGFKQDAKTKQGIIAQQNEIYNTLGYEAVSDNPLMDVAKYQLIPLNELTNEYKMLHTFTDEEQIAIDRLKEFSHIDFTSTSTKGLQSLKSEFYELFKIVSEATKKRSLKGNYVQDFYKESKKNINKIDLILNHRQKVSDNSKNVKDVEKANQLLDKARKDFMFIQDYYDHMLKTSNEGTAKMIGDRINPIIENIKNNIVEAVKAMEGVNYGKWEKILNGLPLYSDISLTTFENILNGNKSNAKFLFDVVLNNGHDKDWFTGLEFDNKSDSAPAISNESVKKTKDNAKSEIQALDEVDKKKQKVYKDEQSQKSTNYIAYGKVSRSLAEWEEKYKTWNKKRLDEDKQFSSTHGAIVDTKAVRDTSNSLKNVMKLFDTVTRDKTKITKADAKTIYDKIQNVLTTHYKTSKTLDGATVESSGHFTSYKTIEEFMNKFRSFSSLNDMMNGKNKFGEKIGFSQKGAYEFFKDIFREIQLGIENSKPFQDGYISWKDDPDYITLIREKQLLDAADNKGKISSGTTAPIKNENDLQSELDETKEKAKETGNAIEEYYNKYCNYPQSSIKRKASDVQTQIDNVVKGGSGSFSLPSQDLESEEVKEYIAALQQEVSKYHLEIEITPKRYMESFDSKTGEFQGLYGDGSHGIRLFDPNRPKYTFSRLENGISEDLIQEFYKNSIEMNKIIDKTSENFISRLDNINKISEILKKRGYEQLGGDGLWQKISLNDLSLDDSNLKISGSETDFRKLNKEFERLKVVVSDAKESTYELDEEIAKLAKENLDKVENQLKSIGAVYDSNYNKYHRPPQSDKNTLSSNQSPTPAITNEEAIQTENNAEREVKAIDNVIDEKNKLTDERINAVKQNLNKKLLGLVTATIPESRAVQESAVREVPMQWRNALLAKKTINYDGDVFDTTIGSQFSNKKEFYNGIVDTIYSIIWQISSSLKVKTGDNIFYDDKITNQIAESVNSLIGQQIDYILTNFKPTKEEKDLDITQVTKGLSSMKDIFYVLSKFGVDYSTLNPNYSNLQEFIDYVPTVNFGGDSGNVDTTDAKQFGEQAAKDIYQGGKEEFKIKSPSKVFEELGYWCGEGWIVGFNKDKEKIAGTIAEFKNTLIAEFKKNDIKLEDLVSFYNSDAFNGSRNMAIGKATKQIINDYTQANNTSPIPDKFKSEAEFINYYNGILNNLKKIMASTNNTSMEWADANVKVHEIKKELELLGYWEPTLLQHSSNVQKIPNTDSAKLAVDTVDRDRMIQEAKGHKELVKTIDETNNKPSPAITDKDVKSTQKNAKKQIDSIKQVNKEKNKAKEVEDNNKVVKSEDKVTQSKKEKNKVVKEEVKASQENIETLNRENDLLIKQAEEMRKNEIVISQRGFVNYKRQDEFGNEDNSGWSYVRKLNEKQYQSVKYSWNALKDENGDQLLGEDGKPLFALKQTLGEVVTGFEQLENAIIKADNKVAGLEKRLELNKRNPNLLNYDSSALESEIEAAKDEAQQLLSVLSMVYDSDDKYQYQEKEFEKRWYDNQIRLKNDAQDTYNVKAANELAKADKKAQKDEKQKQKEISQTNRKLNEQLEIIDHIERTYDKQVNPKLNRSVTNTDDLKELRSDKSAIISEINRLIGLNKPKNEIETEMLNVTSMINQYKDKAKYTLASNNPATSDLSGTKLSTAISTKVSQYDILIQRAEKYGDVTSDLVEKLKLERDILNQKNDDGTYKADAQTYNEYRDSLKISTAEFRAREQSYKKQQFIDDINNGVYDNSINKINQKYLGFDVTKFRVDSILDAYESLQTEAIAWETQLRNGNISLDEYGSHVEQLVSEFIPLTNAISENENVMKRIRTNVGKLANINKKGDDVSGLELFDKQMITDQFKKDYATVLSNAKLIGDSQYEEDLKNTLSKLLQAASNDVNKPQDNTRQQINSEALSADTAEWSHALKLLSENVNNTLKLTDIVSIQRKVRRDEKSDSDYVSYQYTDKRGSSATFGANGELLIQNNNIVNLQNYVKLYEKLSELVQSLASKRTGKSTEYLNNVNKLTDNISELKDLLQKPVSSLVSQEAQDQIEALLTDTTQLLQTTKNLEFKGSSEGSRTKLLSKIAKWEEKNTKAMSISRYADEIYDIKDALNKLGNDANVSELSARFNKLDIAVREAGQSGKSFADTISMKLKHLTASTIAYYFSIMDLIRYGRTMFETIRTLDTALVDLQKTTKMNSTELNRFYLESNEVAKRMGVTTEEIINQASAWSRLGYSSREAVTTMAELSSQFATISPGMDTDTATDGLVSSMKAKCMP